MKSLSHAKSTTFAKNSPEAKNNPWRPLHGSSAFSLTEVVIAMGVATVAFTSIIALFPLGLNMSKETYDETLSAMIAQTILADLKDQQVGSKNLRYSSPNNPYFYKLIQVAGGVDPQKTTNNYLGIDLRVINNKQEVYLAYDAQPRSDTDPSGKPIMARPSAGKLNTVPDWYSGASPSNGLVAVAKVTFCPTFTITTLANDTGVMRVDVSVETPGNAKPENRKVRLYTGAVVP